MSCQCLKAKRFQTQPELLASPKPVEVLATEEVAPAAAAAAAAP